MDRETIVFATGGYDHCIKFWQAHDGVCYRTAQHPDSVQHLFANVECKSPHLILGPLFGLYRVHTTAGELSRSDSGQETCSLSR